MSRPIKKDKHKKKGKKKRPSDVWPGMTRKQHDALACYVRLTADACGLAHWTIVLDDKPADEEALAAITVTFGRLHATMRVCDDWMEQPVATRRHAVMHELVHVHTDRVEQPFRDEADGHLSPGVYSVLLNSMHTNMEFAVDELAKLLVKFSDDTEIVHYLKGRMKP